jgi:hypothetical protein
MDLFLLPGILPVRAPPEDIIMSLQKGGPSWELDSLHGEKLEKPGKIFTVISANHIAERRKRKCAAQKKSPDVSAPMN